MKNTKERLISLLGLCSDNKPEATRLQLLTSITQSDDYFSLRKSVALKSLFEKLYDYTKLEQLSNNELKERETLLHQIVFFNEQLLQCLHRGNGPELTSEDFPDFTSLDSITKLCNKIRLSYKTINYTNISEDSALAIFSDSTVKSAKDCFDMLPVSITKSESIDDMAIKQNMGNTLFCINIEEFNAYHEGFLRFADKSEAIIAKEKFRRKKHRLLKIAIVMLCFGAIFACSQFGLFSSDYTPQFLFGMIIVAVLFLIWG